jgi:hypothetical protein
LTARLPSTCQTLSSSIAPRVLCAHRTHLTPIVQLQATRLKTYGDRSFKKMAPLVWNSLPLSIRRTKSLIEFRSALKTTLVNTCFALRIASTHLNRAIHLCFSSQRLLPFNVKERSCRSDNRKGSLSLLLRHAITQRCRISILPTR